MTLANSYKINWEIRISRGQEFCNADNTIKTNIKGKVLKNKTQIEQKLLKKV